MGNGRKGRRQAVDKWKKTIMHMGAYPAALGKWVLLGGIIGVAGGVIGSLFHIGVNYATAIRGALKCCRGIDRDDPKIIRIQNTLHLKYIQVSRALLPNVEADPRLTLVDGPED